ncbi:hypothetical protein CGRA01v4_02687 [Colletotrichum graminicola]|nr:hypothetical protein CGRA01v4_02687 [Colletotrichum graminicola]
MTDHTFPPVMYAEGRSGTPDFHRQISPDLVILDLQTFFYFSTSIPRKKLNDFCPTFALAMVCVAPFPRLLDHQGRTDDSRHFETYGVETSTFSPSGSPDELPFRKAGG